ncbi:MAG: 4-hydroxy-3-methylbut-2-enyl diphosphate reductase [Candidatus Zixiibacteriota bacterium]|nr:MAG: 4-hydroxy-3-methylbut-2-enyl diphosphate reductase [candidate division Zixibacteria bacterium]
MRIGLKKIIIAEHYGFCMGVKRAISIARDTMGTDDRVTILKEIVHNDAVVEEFQKAGVGQSFSIDSVENGTVIIPAHGASPDVFEKARSRGLNVVDATCPLVIRIHRIIRKLAEDGYHIVHYGDPEHDETKGIVGHAPNRVIVISDLDNLNRVKSSEGRIALTSQTTARDVDFQQIERAVKVKFPRAEVFNTICNATKQRQDAVMELAPRVDMMLIVGSRTSANSNRLALISGSICKTSYLINTADDIELKWLTESAGIIEVVGLSAGASTPDFLIDGAIERLREVACEPVEVVYPKKKAKRNTLALKNDPT